MTGDFGSRGGARTEVRLVRLHSFHLGVQSSRAPELVPSSVGFVRRSPFRPGMQFLSMAEPSDVEEGGEGRKRNADAGLQPGACVCVCNVPCRAVPCRAVKCRAACPITLSLTDTTSRQRPTQTNATRGHTSPSAGRMSGVVTPRDCLVQRSGSRQRHTPAHTHTCTHTHLHTHTHTHTHTSAHLHLHPRAPFSPNRRRWFSAGTGGTHSGRFDLRLTCRGGGREWVVVACI